MRAKIKNRPNGRFRAVFDFTHYKSWKFQRKKRFWRISERIRDVRRQVLLMMYLANGVGAVGFLRETISARFATRVWSMNVFIVVFRCFIRQM
nr:MAG TPA: hypothetical protein [Bacteriophage sp.]